METQQGAQSKAAATVERKRQELAAAEAKYQQELDEGKTALELFEEMMELVPRNKIELAILQRYDPDAWLVSLDAIAEKAAQVRRALS
jgi:hypothetical protein